MRCDRSRQIESPEGTPLTAPPGLLLLEYESPVVEQLAFEADLVGTHPGGECESEIRARQPARNKRQLEQALPEAGGADPRVPLLDRLDVIEAAVATRYEAKRRLCAFDDLLLAKWKP